MLFLLLFLHDFFDLCNLAFKLTQIENAKNEIQNS